MRVVLHNKRVLKSVLTRDARAADDPSRSAQRVRQKSASQKEAHALYASGARDCGPSVRTLFKNLKICLSVCALLILFTNTPARAQDITTGLIGHWKLEESSGALVDSSVNGNNGTAFGSPTYGVAGQIGGAMLMDGTDDYVDVGDPASLEVGTSDFSGCAWIKTSSTTPQTVFGKRILTSNGWIFRIQDTSDRLTLQIDDGGVSTLNNGSNVTYDDGAWRHVCFSADRSANVDFYLDGSPVGSANITGHQLTLDNTSNFCIGTHRCESGPTGFFNGTIDEVRIYNRALSAADIAALYAYSDLSCNTSSEGSLVYNTDHALMQYCDGTDWRMMGTGSYNPAAVEFDGTNDYAALGGSLAGATDGNKFTFSLWLDKLGADGDDDIIFTQVSALGGSSLRGVTLTKLANNSFSVNGRSSVPAVLLSLTSPPNSILSSGGWYHIMGSYDLSDSTKRHLYINDVPDIDTVSNYTNGSINFTTVDNILGARGDGTSITNANVADLWVDFGTYIDLSVESNRRKFISDSGMPMYLGPDGSLPTGNVPDLFLSGDDVVFVSNRGTGGGVFTENGDLTYSSSQPGDSVINAPYTNPFIPNSGNAWVQDATKLDGPYDVAVVGNYAYVVSQVGDSLTVVDVSDPLNPVIANGGNAWLQDTTKLNNPRGIVVIGGYAYVSSRNSNSLTVVDISDPLNPVIANSGNAWVTDATKFNGAYELAVVGDYAYVASNLGDSLTVVDISDPLNPVIANGGNAWLQDAVKLNGAYGVAVVGNYAYVTGFDGDSLTVVDVSDPLNPVIANSGNAWVTDATKLNGVDGIAVSGNYAYVAGSISNSLTVVDISDPLNPVIANGGNAWVTDATKLNGAYELAVVGDYAYVTSFGGDSLTVVDISDPLNPVIANGGNAWVTDATKLNGAYKVAVVGNYAYVGSVNADSLTVVEIDVDGCLSPGGDTGTIIYNADFNVMQYCNGAEWVAMGPTGGTPPTNGLIAHWKLDETSGTTAADSAGSFNGTMTGGLDAGTDSVDAVVNTGLLFDGTGDNIDVTDSGNALQTAPFSVSAWIKIDTLASVQGHGNAVFRRREPLSAPWFSWMFYQKDSVNTDHFRFELAEPGLTYKHADSDDPFTTNRWYHVLGTIDSGLTATLYVDGVAQADVVTLSGLYQSGDTELTIGSDGGAGLFDGTLDDLRIYNRVLSQQEISQLYYYGLSGGLGDVSGNCTSPSRPEGAMIYNSDHNLMQYCNGEQWIKIGH